MIEGVEQLGDAKKYVQSELDKGNRLMGFGHRVYRAEDPRARVLRRTAKELDAPRYEVAAALEQAALEELHARKPDRVLATNVEYWAAVVLDFAEVPSHMFTSMFTCARTAGWAAHILSRSARAGWSARVPPTPVPPRARSASSRAPTRSSASTDFVARLPRGPGPGRAAAVAVSRSRGRKTLGESGSLTASCQRLSLAAGTLGPPTSRYDVLRAPALLRCEGQ